MGTEIVWLSRAGAGVRHAFRVVHVLGARTALCGQTSDGWVQDDHCDQCKRCLKQLAKISAPTDLMRALRDSLDAAKMAKVDTDGQ